MRVKGEAAAERTHNMRFSIEILALLAVVYARQGCDAAAERALERRLN